MQYAVVAPWAARSTYRFLTASGSDDQRRDLLGFAVLPVLLLARSFAVGWPHGQSTSTRPYMSGSANGG